MDELDLFQPPEETPGTTDDIELATVSEVGTDGVKLLIDGNEEAGAKEYRVNIGQMLRVGDRVKISRVSGSYVVDYVVGSPMARYAIPAGGTDGQILTKDGDNPFAVKWATAAGGLPSGGSSGQVLAKTSSTDYAVGWVDASGLPTGGTAGQVLTKVNATNYNAQWSTIGTVPSGGSAGQVLIKTNATNYNVEWATPSVGLLKNGPYTLTLSAAGVLTPNTSASISLGNSTYPIGNLYANGNIELGTNAYSAKLGFFGTNPISKITNITTSSTLSSLIQALKNYGLL